MRKTIKPMGEIIINTILVVLGLFMLVFGLSFLIKGLVEDKNFIECEATVKSIIENEEERYISISFFVDSEEIVTKYPYFDKGLDVGDLVTIKYNPDDFYDVTARNKGYLLTSSIVIVVGIFLVLYKGFILLGYIKEKNRVEDLIKNGKEYKANIICVEEDEKNISMGISPYIIVCEIKDDDKSYILTSKDIYVSDNITGLVGSKISVYIKNNDFNNYYIDYMKVEK